MLSNTQQLYLCQYMKEYENDSFFFKIAPIFFWPPSNLGKGWSHTAQIFLIYNLLPLTTMQNMKCLAFLEVF